MSSASYFNNLKHRAKAVEALSFRNSALILIVVNIVGVIAINLRNISIAEMVSMEQLGQLTILWSYSAVLITVFSIGWPQILTRNIASDTTNISQLGLAILSTQTLLFAFCLLTYLTFSVAGMKLSSVALMAYPVSALGIFIQLLLSVVEGYRKVIWSRLAQGVVWPLLVLVLIISLSHAAEMNPLLSFVGGQIIFLLGVIVLMSLLHISLQPVSKGMWSEIFRSSMIGLRRENFWVLTIAGFNTLLISEDVLILQFFVDDADIGQYGILASIVVIIAVGMSAVNAIFVPDFAKSLKEKDTLKATSLFHHSRSISTVWSAIAVFLLFAIVAVVPEWFALSDGIGLLVILLFLALGKVSSAITGPCTNVMFVYGNTSTIAYSVIVACVLNFIGNLLLIPNWGLLGAAISTGLSIASINVWQFLYIKKNFGF